MFIKIEIGPHKVGFYTCLLLNFCLVLKELSFFTDKSENLCVSLTLQMMLFSAFKEGNLFLGIFSAFSSCNGKIPAMVMDDCNGNG